VTPHVVVCLDKFRGSLSAERACHALAEGIKRGSRRVTVLPVPVADGGEGTVDALVRAGYERRTVAAHDPAGEPITADFAVSHGRAVVELAQASGLHHVAGRKSPLTASTFGTGEVIRAALDQGCTSIVLAVGGSATTDGGAGMLQALGARLIAPNDDPVGPGGVGLLNLDHIDLTGLDSRLLQTELVLASDVSIPLLGQAGAAAVFGPQKGAATADIAQLEKGLGQFAKLIARETGDDLSATPGAGAAGGAGLAALSALRARHRPGIDFLLEELRITEILRGASLAIMGEGRLDGQSLHGKAPTGVAARAARSSVPLVAVAGQIELTGEQMRSLGAIAAYSLVEEAGSVEVAMSEAWSLLIRVGHQIAARHLHGL
jgi:glycerate kinase